jgi:hypothetical protein
MPRLAITGLNFCLWFGGIWLFVGLPFLIIGLYVGAQHVIVNNRLDTEGRTIEGMVLTKEIRTSSSSQSRGRSSSVPTYHVTFRFVTPSGLITSDAEVNLDVWDKLVEREPIQVTYLPDAPQHYRIEGQSSGWVLPIIFTVLGGFFTVVGGYIFWRGLSQSRSREQLQREGFTTEATVTQVSPRNVWVNGVQQWAIHYEYRDDRSRTHEGKSPLSPEEAEAWKEGDKGVVRYDRGRPKRSVWLGRA